MYIQNSLRFRFQRTLYSEVSNHSLTRRTLSYHVKNELLVLWLRVNHYSSLIYVSMSVTPSLTVAGWLSKE